MEILKVEDLSFSYGKENILNNLNFSVEVGDFVAIMGTNGTGKSTLLKLLLKELEPNSGSIKWFGCPIKSFSEFQKVGYVPQHNILSSNSFPATVLEVVRSNLFSKIGFLKFPTKKDNLKVVEVLKLVGIEHLQNKLIGNLSGGQQQKVMLARALVSDPEILILDEPTTGIDQTSCEELYRILGEFNKGKKLTIVIVTHDLASVYEYLCKAFYLTKGTVQELSTKQIMQFEHNTILCEHLPHISVKDAIK